MNLTLECGKRFETFALLFQSRPNSRVKEQATRTSQSDRPASKGQSGDYTKTTVKHGPTPAQFGWERSNLPLISCDRRPSLFGNAQERVDDLWVKLTTGQVADRFACGLERRSTPIGPVGCDGIESIRYGKDPGAQKNFSSLEAAWIAPALVALVVHDKDFGCVCKKRDVLDEVEPDLHMLLHKFPLVRGERSRLE